MKNIYFALTFILLMVSCSSDDDAQDTSPGIMDVNYSLVDIKYTLEEGDGVKSTWVTLCSDTINNLTNDTMIYFFNSQLYKVIKDNSHFYLTHPMLDTFKLDKPYLVGVPFFSIEDSLTLDVENLLTMRDFRLNEVCELDGYSVYTSNVIIPPHCVYHIYLAKISYSLSASFTAQLANTSTGMLTSVQGKWNGIDDTSNTLFSIYDLTNKKDIERKYILKEEQ